MSGDTGNGNSVLDMVNSYAEISGQPVDDIFKRDDPPPEAEIPATIKLIAKSEKPSDDWSPRDALVEDMPELKDGSGAIYDKGEISISDPNGPRDLLSVTDDQIAQVALDQMDELHRAEFTIERAKAQLGIKHLNTPSLYIAKIMSSATDTNASRALENVVPIINEVITLFPEAVIEWLPGFPRVSENGLNPDMLPSIEPKIVEHVEPTTEDIKEEKADSPDTAPLTGDPAPDRSVAAPIVPDDSVPPAPDVTIIIDKRQASDIVFDGTEKDQIRRARSIELKIVEDRELYYNVLDDPVNDIEEVLSQYTRKFNDISVSLPASRYRCTLTGLSYPEIMDLSYSQDQNNLDGERKKWTIAYAHVQNASIGKFADYDDFLRKTSYLDLDFILWGILCATCMPYELILIDCHTKDCGNSYDWTYSPGSLLQVESISPQVLEEMRVTGEAMTAVDIEKNYNESMLRLSNSVKLPHSGFIFCFGHISAYTYLNEVYGKLENIRNQENPSIVDAATTSTLTVVKYILVPTGDSYRKVTGSNDITRIISVLNEIDFRALSELVSIMTEPYTMNYVMRDIVCPKCKTKSSITIEDMSRLLFIVVQSLSNVNVSLRR